MQDLEFNDLFFAAITLGMALVVFFFLRFRFLHICRMAACQKLTTMQRHDLPFYYSSYAVKQECLRKFFRLSPKAIHVLAHTAMKNIRLAVPLINRKLLSASKQLPILLLAAEIFILQNKRSPFRHIIENIAAPAWNTPAALKAKYLYLSALNNLYLTDMMSASQQASAALKIYQKLEFSYEEAECYQALAQIYRISGIHDVALTMLQEAEKIYTHLGLTAKIAETTAYLGLNEIGRENFTVAEEYLLKAKSIAHKNKLLKTQAAIYNWLGLVYYIQHQIDMAARYFYRVSSRPQTTENKAYALEMLARINYQKKDYDKAFNFAQKALLACKKLSDDAGIFENLYLQAQILYTQEKYSASEKILTELIRRKAPFSTIYYPANAYTLLGLVNLQKNCLDTAKTLFKQAVDLERAQNRLKGAAVDYNNLAELAQRQGLPDEAATYIRQALAYAEDTNDEELKVYLLSKL